MGLSSQAQIKSREISVMNNTWFLIWRRELFQTVRRLLAQFCFSLGDFGSNKNKSAAPQLRNDAANEIRSLH